MPVSLKAGSTQFTIPEEEYMYSGHSGCPGCGVAIALRYTLKALGSKIVMVVCASCTGTISGLMPTSCFKIPVVHCAFMAAAATTAGIKQGLKIQGDDETPVVAWAGDGGTFDIGLQGLSAVAERNEDILFICADNEAYMNTGIQRSSATPSGAWTTTSPLGAIKNRPKKNIMEIMIAHEIPYAATATIGYPNDLVRKAAKAKDIRGTKFLHLLTPCPTGWRYPTELTMEVSRIAVESKLFPLYEVENGNYKITQLPRKDIPVSDYLKSQGRFSSLNEAEIVNIQGHVDVNWEKLLAKAKI